LPDEGSEDMEFNPSIGSVSLLSVQQEVWQPSGLSEAGSEVRGSSSPSLLEVASLSSAVGCLEGPDAPRATGKESVVARILTPICTDLVPASTAPLEQKPPPGVPGSSVNSPKQLLPSPQALTFTDLAPASTSACDPQPPAVAGSSVSSPKRLLPLPQAQQPCQVVQSEPTLNSLPAKRCVTSGVPCTGRGVRQLTADLERRYASQNNFGEALPRTQLKLHRRLWTE